MKYKKIAIIGIDCKFPGANSVEEYWENLCQGRSSISRFSDEELRSRGVPESLLQNPQYIKARPVLSNIDFFDAPFFNFSPREAEMMDPQQRLALQCAWNTFEDAGYPLQKKSQNVGVFIGSGGAVSSYLLSCMENDAMIKGNTGSIEHIGNDKDFVATRISYKLNLTGPSIAVQTACSTSLVAVHYAVQSLRNGDCEMAIAGGVNIRIPHEVGYLYQEGGIHSADGHCRAFDKNASGIVFGSGMGMVLLKPYDQAIKDRDNIYAVIAASCANNDGMEKLSYTASSMQGQLNCMKKAFKESDLDPKALAYIEAHGTGTAIGDPIEINSISHCLSEYKLNKASVFIGSVKNNIGHADVASGIASLIKTVLILKNKKIPPCINFQEINPKINLDKTPLKINSSLQKIKKVKNSLIYAGVNSLGIGGTNAFVVLHDHEEKLERVKNSSQVLPFPFSGKNKDAVQRRISNFYNFLKNNKDANLNDISYTLCHGRTHFKYRTLIIADSKKKLIEALESLLNFNFLEANDQLIFSNFRDFSNLKNDKKLKNYEKLLSFIDGDDEAFNQLDIYGQRISLPSYPFEEKSYWVKDNANHSLDIEKSISQFNSIEIQVSPQYLFSISKEHLVNGISVFPAAGFISYVSSLYSKFFKKLGEVDFIQLNHVQFLNMIEKDSTVICQMNKDLNGGRASFLIGDKLHFSLSIANAITKEAEFNPTIINPEIKLSADEIYSKFRKIGLNYGNSYRLLSQIMVEGDKIIADYQVPKTYQLLDITSFPQLIDNAFQATIGFFYNDKNTSANIPFAIENFSLSASTKIPEFGKIHVRRNSKTDSYDIQLFNHNNKLVIDINGLILKPLKNIPINFYKSFEATASSLEIANDLGCKYIILNKTDDYFESFDDVSIINSRRKIEEDFEQLESLYQNEKQNICLVYLWNNDLAALFSLIKRLSKYDAENIINFILVVRNDFEFGDILGSSVKGLLQGLVAETVKINFQIIAVEKLSDLKSYYQNLLDLSNYKKNWSYVVKNNKLSTFEYRLVSLSKGSKSLQEILGDKSTVLVSGGLGGIGKQVVQYFLNNCNANIVIIGRSSAKPEDSEFLSKLRGYTNVEYFQCDIAKIDELASIIKKIKSKFGNISCIVNCAGILGDSLLSNKTEDSLQKVISPKVYGTYNLDLLTKNEPIKFFVMFSSISADHPLPGQSDYALGNQFMIEYSRVRKDLVKQGQRNGNTLVVSWPYWKDGGMKMTQSNIDNLKRDYGLDALTNADGIDAFGKLLLSDATGHFIVAPGFNPHLWDDVSQTTRNQLYEEKTISVTNNLSTNVLTLEEKIRLDIGEIMMIPPDSFTEDQSLEDLGLDSIMGLMAIDKISNSFSLKGSDRVPVSIFTNKVTLGKIVSYVREKVSAEQ